ncbi:Porphobilinogen deaminase [Rhynchospora pubera]|uniref:Porphobilinogen deaminase n=1 Tax=Rhynchospora pubera TaxID=906938 RepID=A0AAV8H0V0_9POAL|nr:Porphobilinogen deaminase [Rhynchospora pubera]KAJ4757781.1 Porphobilinogen deaminase [Rhynchospora pubera]KAJ4810250.1 Porphobilinogen deaminase [Rhynchospora pubera]
MGNSCLKPRALTWVDDEEDYEQEVLKSNEEKRKCKDKNEYSSSSSLLKIKITKKQLEEILKLSSKRQLPVEVLSNFINSRNTVLLSEQTSRWRPKLQTIAEQDE